METKRQFLQKELIKKSANFLAAWTNEYSFLRNSLNVIRGRSVCAIGQGPNDGIYYATHH